MGAIDEQALIVHTRKKFKKKRRITFNSRRRRTRNKRIPKETLQIFDATLVMKREILQEIVPSRNIDTMLIFLKMMN